MKVRWMIATVWITGAVACVKDEGPVSGANGKLQLLVATPDAVPENISVDNTVALSSVPFLGQGSTSSSPGFHTLSVTASAGSIKNSPIGIGANQVYDEIVVGTAADGTLQFLGAQNNAPTFDLTKVAGVRMFNAVTVNTDSLFSNHADSVDIYFLNQAGDSAKYSYTGIAQFGPANAAAAGVPIYVSVNPGTYRIRGTATGQPTDITVDSTLTFTAGQLRTIVFTTKADRTTGAIAVIADN